MFGILCLKDGDPDCTLMIMDEDESMFTWPTLKEAQDFAKDHIMCRISVVLYIDLENYRIEH